jgi:hypothetical protein
MTMADWTVHAFRLTALGSNVIYVGASYHRPAARLRQHEIGYKRSRQARNGRPVLAEELYDHLPPFQHRELAEDAADDLATELISAGYDVRCDPDRRARIFSRVQRMNVPPLLAAGSDRRIAIADHHASLDRYAA